MKLTAQHIYHIYNRGNHKQPIFFSEDNYLFFLKKIRVHILPFSEILCYCLMPNHFHLMIYTPENFNEEKFYNNYKILLSSYTRAINKASGLTGSLFQQNSKFKQIIGVNESYKSDQNNYAPTCFHYIHQNPFKAKLVAKMEDWKFSSFIDYAGLRNGTLCNQSLAKSLLELPSDQKEFYQLSYDVIDDGFFDKIF